MRARIERRDMPAPPRDWPAQVHPVVQRVLAARGVCSPEQAELRLRALLPPDTLSGLDDACTLLEAAMREDQHLMVVGDFDADGATGTAVAVRGLRALGARRVDFRVPHRIAHGYGLSPELVDDLAEPLPDVLMTVDSGIACHAGVVRAKQRGMRVLITDHHLPGASLPPADAIVNPNLPNCAFASRALAGVGVVFYLLMALRARLRTQGWFGAARTEPDLSELLDLVAIGTVADLVPLDRNNRVLVAAGLKRIRAGQASVGVRALLAAAGRDAASLSSLDLGYVLGPRINAAGRMDDMRVGIACLLADDPAQAAPLAAQLDQMNAERRALQADMLDQAQTLLQTPADLPDAHTRVGVCVSDPNWHAGVVGLVATKLKEQLHRPVVAFAPAQEGDAVWRGSARSVPGFHIRDALADVAARHPGLIVRFGGHAMAAGLTIAAADIARFAEAFDACAKASLGATLSTPVLWSDGELGGADATYALATALDSAAPWGQGFPEPLFDNVFRVEKLKIMAERHLRMTLRYAACGTAVDAVYFNAPELHAPAQVRALYQLAIDTWRGERRLRLLLRHWEPA